MSEYQPTPLPSEFTVEGLITVHYFEYSGDFYFPGETHNFWELLYVDKGKLDVVSDEHLLHLNKGDIVFHKPMEFHNLRAVDGVAPNLVVISFLCQSPAMAYFKDKMFATDGATRDLLGNLVQEAGNAFQSRLDNPDLRRLEPRRDGPFGALQLLRLNLEMLLIHLTRQENEGEAHKVPSTIREKSERNVFVKVTQYLEKNLSTPLTLDDVCRDNLVGRSYLQRVFREATGGGVMEYFGKMKIDAAKREIREGAGNFTEISNILGYSSIHYFSRHFKKVTGMTPTEYASSVKVRAESQKDRPVINYE